MQETLGRRKGQRRVHWCWPGEAPWMLGTCYFIDFGIRLLARLVTVSFRDRSYLRDWHPTHAHRKWHMACMVVIWSRLAQQWRDRHHWDSEYRRGCSTDLAHKLLGIVHVKRLRMGDVRFICLQSLAIDSPLSVLSLLPPLLLSIESFAM